MTEPQGKAGGITRRSFLASTAVGLGATAIALNSPNMQAFASDVVPMTEDEVYYGRCMFGGCFNCEREIIVREGHVVATRPSTRDTAFGRRPCARGYNHTMQSYSPMALQYPMKRVEGTARGDEQWERISWDEAFALVIDKFGTAMREYGNQSVLYGQQSGTYGLISGYQMYRLAHMLGWTFIEASVDNALGVGQNRVTGSGSANVMYHWEEQVYNSKNVILWSTNTSEAYVQRYRHLIMAQRGGTKLHCVDPNETMIAQRSHRWYPVRPGADIALILSCCQYIVEQGLQDTEFIMSDSAGTYLINGETGNYLRMSDLGVEPTEGPVDAMTGQPTVVDPYVEWDRVTESAVEAGTAEDPALEGAYEVEGASCTTSYSMLVERLQQFKPEDVAEEVGLSVDQIHELARAAADGPTMHFFGYGAACYDNGLEMGWAAAILMALTGAYRQEAGRGTNNQVYAVPIDWSYIFSGGMAPSISVLDIGNVIESGTFKGEPWPIKCLFLCGINLIGGAANQNRVTEFVNKLDFVVTTAITYTDNCVWSDLILPAAMHAEREEYAASPLDFTISYTPKMMEPGFERLPLQDMVRAFADGFGVGDEFSRSDDEVIARLLSDSLFTSQGITVERIKEEVTVPYRTGTFWVRTEGWTTPTKKLEFYCEDPTRSIRMENESEMTEEYMDHLPSFRKPREAWEGTEAMQKYPIICQSVRAKHRWHNDGYDSPWLKDLEPEPVMRINPDDARERGLADGDYAEFYNDRGSCVMRVYTDAALHPGVVTYPKGMDRRQFKRGTYSALTSSYCNPVHVNTSFFDTCVEMRKWEGEE